jgi:hypothetical protein
VFAQPTGLVRHLLRHELSDQNHSAALAAHRFLFWLQHRAATRFVIPFVILSLTLWIEPLIRFPQLFFRNVFSYNSYWGSWGISYLLKLTHWPQFNGGFFNLSTTATVVAWILKLAIICAVITIAWRRRGLAIAR